ncbi:MAG: type II secretion system protein GspL, partial [Gammaproteobacteria bacterium]|nr:type II secretion system protein GspL [Gammaproteobacteria bacterium]
VRSGPFSGYYCDRDNLPLVLSSLIKQAEPAPEFITLLHRDDDDLASLFDELQLPLKKISYKNSALNIFAQYINPSQALNILQGDYTPKRESNALLQPWKAVAALVTILVMLQLIYAGILGQQLETQNKQLTQQIEQQFKQAIPGARKFNNIRNRMERTLKDLRGGKGTDQPDFLHLLSTAANALGADKKIIIQAMVYRNKHIDLELQADSLQSLENLKTKLASLRDIKAVLSTSIEKDKVNGRLRLEKQG